MFTDRDELEHHGAAAEAWWWWGQSADATVGLFVGLHVRGQRFDYRAGLWRRGQPFVYIEELGGTGRRAGLELKPPEMWADHMCDVPFGQWSVGNEAHGVLLDDPCDAVVRPYGTPVPVTFDIEWYAAGEAYSVQHGYEQAGEIDAVIELTEGDLRVQGPGRRLHVWGEGSWPDPLVMLTRAGWMPPTL
ncbi:MAG: hypothetical protein F2681_11520 [Actinobacteria bacterium]|nr:hypothetical protein [Actinomycetota bacterium]MSW78856.1 hypothetical protein [Actinomycetota bacterium]MSX54821.1 hypothetical protein [Actinomycetota bacterium]MSX93772.1 hypothetical protein [Actinomycetota bacterium]MSZ83756.1 hypothetical protein [Actinomycetota bacterium]